MMLTDYFPKTEGLLYGYMRQKSSIERMEIEQRRIEKDILDLTSELGALRRNFSIPEQSLSITWGDIYTKTDHDSYQERYIESYGRQIESLEKKIHQLEQRRLKLKVKIINKHEHIRTLDIIITGMSEEQKQIIELKYADKMSNYQIGEKLLLSEATARRKRGEIVEKIAEVMGLLEE